MIGDTPGGTRTPSLLIRSQMLYPIELRARRILEEDGRVASDPAQAVSVAVLAQHTSGFLDHTDIAECFRP